MLGVINVAVGSIASFSPSADDFRSTPVNGHRQSRSACRKSAMCGRLRIGKDFLHAADLVGAAMCSAFRSGSHDRWP
jgi:hypothetical protein